MKIEDIEKAANEFADREYEYNDIDRNGLYKGFYWGAQWRISSIWHKSDEIPTPDKWIATLSRNNVMRIVYSYDTISDYFNVMRITDWAYVRDLLPTKD